MKALCIIFALLAITSTASSLILPEGPEDSQFSPNSRDTFSCKYKDGQYYNCGTQAPDGSWCNNIPFPGCNMCLVTFCLERSHCDCKCTSGSITCSIPPANGNMTTYAVVKNYNNVFLDNNMI